MANKGFTLLEVTICIFVMGLTVTALLNLLNWSTTKYAVVASSWKARSCLTEARIWLRNKITYENTTKLSLKNLSEEVKCPVGFNYKELTVTKHDNDTFFIKLSIYEDKNHNGIADPDETTNRLFCFRRRSA